MWHTQFASVQGRGHRKQGVPCQDRVCVLEREGVTTGALADGAGSARLSQVGAQIAVETVCEMLCQDFGRLISAESPYAANQIILAPIREKIRKWADSHDVPPTELACTLLAVAVRGDEYLLFHVGDGVIGYRKGNHLLVASQPDNGEFCNTTTFVTSRDVLLRCHTIRGKSPDISGFCFLCDGCEAALLDKRRGRLAPLCGYLMERSERLERSASQMLLDRTLSECIAQRTQDDCSVVLMTRETRNSVPWNRMTSVQKAKILGIRTQNNNRRRRLIRRYALDYGVKVDS